MYNVPLGVQLVPELRKLLPDELWVKVAEFMYEGVRRYLEKHLEMPIMFGVKYVNNIVREGVEICRRMFLQKHLETRRFFDRSAYYTKYHLWQVKGRGVKVGYARKSQCSITGNLIMGYFLEYGPEYEGYDWNEEDSWEEEEHWEEDWDIVTFPGVERVCGEEYYFLRYLNARDFDSPMMTVSLGWWNNVRY